MMETFHLESTSGRAPLRIGLMLDSLSVSAWVATILDHIERSNFARVELVILNGAAKTQPVERAAAPVRLWRTIRNKRRRTQFLYNLYTRYEVKRYPIPNNPSQSIDCSMKLAECDKLTVQPITKGFTHRFSPQDLDAIRSYKLDVILRFGFNIIRGEILKVPRYGVWSHHHGDNEYYRGAPPHFWELYEKNPLSGAILQVLTDELDAGLVLCKANLETRQGISVSQNRLQPYWTASLFTIRKLHELHQYGWERIVKRSIPSQLAPGRKTLYRMPTNLETMKFVSACGARSTALFLRGERLVQWRIGIRTTDAPVSPEHPDMHGFRWIEAPKGHFYADPFLLSKDGKTYLFFEDYSYAADKAVICCAEVSTVGQLSEPKTVLDPGYHLSYPFVFEHHGDVYMIPETGTNNSVELYRADRFPMSWRLEQTLFSKVKAVDTTLWIEDGIYWFFVTVADPAEAGPQLFLFFADSLTGEWNYHPDNPVCTDVRYARGGGRIFCQEGRRIRPSQDHSRGYGSALHFREIVELTRCSYREKTVGSVLPDFERRMCGTHTYNQCGNIEVMDGKWLARRERLI